MNFDKLPSSGDFRLMGILWIGGIVIGFALPVSLQVLFADTWQTVHAFGVHFNFGYVYISAVLTGLLFGTIPLHFKFLKQAIHFTLPFVTMFGLCILLQQYILNEAFPVFAKTCGGICFAALLLSGWELLPPPQTRATYH